MRSPALTGDKSTRSNAGLAKLFLPRLCDRSVARFGVDNMRKVSRKQMESVGVEVEAERLR